MTYAEIKTMLDDLDIPVAYYQFPDNTGQEPPFLCFFYPNRNDALADDCNYVKVEHVVIELYTEDKDFALEQDLEGILRDNDIVFSKDEEYIESERMHLSVYETDIIITEE